MRVKKLKQLHINKAWCKGCGICVAFCPGHVLVLDARGKATVADADQCTVCMMCEMRCPDLAIRVETENTVAEPSTP